MMISLVLSFPFFLGLWALGSGFIHFNKQRLQRNIGTIRGSSSTNIDIQYLEANTKEYMKLLLKAQEEGSKVQEYLIGSEDDIKVEYISTEEFTNYCFRCYSLSNPSKSLFIKRAKVLDENTRAQSDANIKYSSIHQLTNEYIASRTFSKYTPSVLPKLLHYNDTSKYLVMEYLTDFKNLQDYMIDGIIDVDCCRFMGTVMGRSHARTHVAILNQSSIIRFQNEFSNLNSFQEWKSNAFIPTIATLTRLRSTTEPESLPTDMNIDATVVVDDIEKMVANFFDEVEQLKQMKTTSTLESRLKMSTEELIRDLNRDGSISRAVEELQTIYLGKKQVQS